MGSYLDFFVSPLPQHSPLRCGHDDGDDACSLQHLQKHLQKLQTADVKPKFKPPRPLAAAARCTVDVTAANQQDADFQ